LEKLENAKKAQKKAENIAGLDEKVHIRNFAYVA
jgi:hypothetical protein